MTPLVDGRGRRVTACGTFARAAHDQPQLYHHQWFFASTTTDRDTGETTISSTTCRRCTELLAVPPQPLEEVLATIAAEAPGRRPRRSGEPTLQVGTGVRLSPGGP